jgi:hypothetical protein
MRAIAERVVNDGASVVIGAGRIVQKRVFCRAVVPLVVLIVRNKAGFADVIRLVSTGSSTRSCARAILDLNP